MSAIIVFQRALRRALRRRMQADVRLAAVWSRSQSAAEEFVRGPIADFAPDAAALHGEAGLQASMKSCYY